jgi:hypothetical protein
MFAINHAATALIIKKEFGDVGPLPLFKQRQYVPLTATRKCPLDCVSI